MFIKFDIHVISSFIRSLKKRLAIFPNEEKEITFFLSFNSSTWWKERDIGCNVTSCYSLLCLINGLRHRNAISIMKEKTVNCINMQPVFIKSLQY